MLGVEHSSMNLRDEGEVRDSRIDHRTDLEMSQRLLERVAWI
jgi:hypothetical protein